MKNVGDFGGCQHDENFELILSRYWVHKVEKDVVGKVRMKAIFPHFWDDFSRVYILQTMYSDRQSRSCPRGNQMLQLTSSMDF